MLYYWQYHRTDFLILMGVLYILLFAILEGSKWLNNRRMNRKRKRKGNKQ